MIMTVMTLILPVRTVLIMSSVIISSVLITPVIDINGDSLYNTNDNDDTINNHSNITITNDYDHDDMVMLLRMKSSNRIISKVKIKQQTTKEY